MSMEGIEEVSQVKKSMFLDMPLDILAEIIELLETRHLCILCMTNGSVKQRLDWAPLKLKWKSSDWTLTGQRWLLQFDNLKSVLVSPSHYWNNQESISMWAMEFACRLPRRLSSLEFSPRLPWAVVPHLPPLLSSLLIESTMINNYTWLSDLPSSLTILGASFERITPILLDSLPRTLVQLRIGCTWRKTVKGSYAHLPPSLTSLISRYSGRLGNFEDEQLPSTLTDLKLFGNAKITDKSIESFPMSITSLDVHCHMLQGRTLGRLNLLSFSIESYSWNADSIPFLPKSLTRLEIFYPSISPSCFSELPPRLQHFECSGENQTLLASLHRLPRTIKFAIINSKMFKMKLK